MNKVEYKLLIPKKLYKVLEELAKKRDSTVAELLRRGIKWVLIEESINKQGGFICVTKNMGTDVIRIKHE